MASELQRTQIIPWLGAGVLTGGATQYSTFGNGSRQATEGKTKIPWPIAGTFRYMRLKLFGSTLTGAQSITVTLYKNGVATALQCVVTQANGADATDTTHSVSVVAGDEVNLKWENPDLQGGRTRFVIEFVSDTDGQLGYCIGGGTNVSSTATHLLPLFSNDGGGWSDVATGSTTTNVASIVAVAGTVNGYRVRLDGAPGAGTSYEFSIVKNGTKQDGAGGTVDTRLTISGTNSSGSVTFSLSLSEGDVAYMQCIPTGTPTARTPVIGLQYTSSTVGEIPFSSFTAGFTSFATATDFFGPMAEGNAWNTNEDINATLGGVTSYLVKRLRFEVSTTVTASIAARKNSGDPTNPPAISLVAASSGSDLTHMLEVTNGDVIGLRYNQASGAQPNWTRWAWVIVPTTTAAGGTRLTSYGVQFGLGAAYYDEVLGNFPAGYWPLNEQLAGTGARDQSGGANNGTYPGGNPLFGQMGPFPHGGTAIKLNGTTEYVSMGDVAAFEFSGAFSVELLFKTVGRASAVMGLVGKALQVGGDGRGWSVYMLSNGWITFAAYGVTGTLVFTTTTSTSLDDMQWHHLVCSWDGTTNANGVKIYVDGVVHNGTAATTGPPAANAALLLFGARDNAGTAGDFFNGYMAGVALYSSALSSGAVGTHYNATVWTNVTDDVILALPGVDGRYGTNGTKPLDRLADSGTLQFALRNGTNTSAGLAGYYSPLHTNCRAGFTYNIPVRVQFTYAATTYTKFWGRLVVIDPEPGRMLGRRTYCIAHDYMYRLTDTDVRELTAQLNKSDNDLIKAVFEAMPHDAQPMALELAATVDTFTYAFNDLQGGRKAAFILNQLLTSSWARGGVRGDGAFWTTNRDATTNQVIDYALDDDMIDLESPSDQSDVFDRVRVVTHPKFVDAAATAVLYEHPPTSVEKPFVSANGGTLVIWPEEGYRNPTNDALTVGGTEMVTPVSGTDFIANSLADGTGTVLTGSVTVTAYFFASTVKLVLTNNHATLGAYFTTLQVRGKGIYDLSPVTSEATSGLGTRPITIDLPYQHNATVGQEIADYVLNEREAITDPVKSITFSPHRSSTLMTLALEGEPGTLITVTEFQTGLDQAQAAVRLVQWEIRDNLVLFCTLGLTPIVVGFEWILGDAEFSVLGETTVVAA